MKPLTKDHHLETRDYYIYRVILGGYFVHFVVPMGIFPWEFWVTFPIESQLQQLHHPNLINYKVHAGSFHVSITHQTLNMDYRIVNVRH